MTVKHATASTFIFARQPAGWRLGLIVHPIFGKLMLPGGHVEADEAPPEAAGREVAEESGLLVSFVPAPGRPAQPVGVVDRKFVSVPWWIMEQPIDSDNHVAAPHLHLDHLYVAIAAGTEPVSEPAHPFAWYGRADLAGLDMFDDTRVLAGVLFGRIEEIAAAGRA